jgi:predicted GIY-YIG superfamily endonuclease
MNGTTDGMGMAFWVYILKCADGSYYTGHTENLEKRVA